MRGKVSKCPPVDFFHRITPAYAGKSGSGNFSARSGRDHPRLCGEKGAAGKDLQRSGGSPPPMRGKGNRLFSAFSAAGITPAYAGKSTLATAVADLPRDHPRLCGEKHKPDLFRTGRKGSPPPMRGKAEIFSRLFNTSRITPAYAGKRPETQI